MTAQADPSSTATGCGCDTCRNGDLPANPFLALRVVYGMLLGEDDFRTLIGYPRGKQMLHNSWLHGSGVVWGYRVAPRGLRELEVGPGLALDGIGRELLHEATERLDLRALVEAAATAGPSQPDQDRPRGCEPDHGDPGQDTDGCRTVTVEGCVLAEFDSCLSDPVPTLADPCDVTRSHDDYSRVRERARIVVRIGCCPPRRRRYHRVRVLLGLDRVGSPDEAGHEAAAARRAVAAAGDPARELLRQFRLMACQDGMDLHPDCETGENYAGNFPVPEEESAVVLARFSVRLRDRDGCWEFVAEPCVENCVRSTLLPTDVIAELTCARSPGLLGAEPPTEEDGPRVIGPGIELTEHGRRLVIPVTADLVPGSVPGSVGITSLSPGKSGGWVVEDIYDTAYDSSLTAIVVRLADRPVNRLIRVCVRGTGGKPVMGQDPLVPLAGLQGGPPGSAHEGHDAIWTFPNPEAANHSGQSAAYPDDSTEAAR